MNPKATSFSSVGQYRIVLFQSIELTPMLDEASAQRLLQMRGNNTSTKLIQKCFADKRVQFGNFRKNAENTDLPKKRSRIAHDRYKKAVISDAFLERGLPYCLAEPNDSSVASSCPHVKPGSRLHLDDPHTGSRAEAIYDGCQLRVYPDLMLSFRFSFSGSSSSVDNLINTIRSLRHLTYDAAIERVTRGLLMSSDSDSLMAQFLLRPSDLVEKQLFRPAGGTASHCFILVDRAFDEHRQEINPGDLKDSPDLIGLLKQTGRASQYRVDFLEDVRGRALGYKTDEMYVTLRGTTAVFSALAWNPTDFLSFYVEDLVELSEYIVSRIGYLDVMAAKAHDLATIEPTWDANEIDDIVGQLVRLRRLLAQIEDSLDLDFMINHYFTRGFLTNLLEERGIRNKFGSITRRLERSDDVLELISLSNFSRLGLGFGKGQIKLAIWALAASVVFSAASLIVSIFSLK